MKRFEGSPHPWHWEGDKLCDANHMIINGGKFKFKKHDKALVTAAPNLLEALQELVFLYEHDEGCRELTEYKRAKAAISKALGEE